MRILHVIGTLDPAAGGPPAVVCRLASAQAASGDEVCVLCYANPPRQSAVAEAVNRVPGFGEVRTNTVQPDRGMARLTASRARRALGQWCDEAIEQAPGQALVHLHGVWEPLLKAAADVARRHHMPYVLTPHGMLDPWALQQRRLKKKLALALGYRAMIHGAAVVHALNATEAELMAPLRLRQPPAVAPNAVFLEEVPWPPPPRGAGDLPRVLFLGRLHAKKGLDVLIEAFAIVAAEHATVELVIAGPDAGAEASARAAVRRLGLDARVQWAGSVSSAQKWSLLASATCFCLPSKQEGFSVAALEALASGVPVVLSEGCHFPEVAEAGAGLIVPRQVEAVATALSAILGDPARAADMARRGRELVETRYTWPLVAARIADIYRTALA